MAKKHLAVLLLALVLVVVLVNLGQVWALAVTPGTPIAGQQFTLTGSGGGGPIIVYNQANCRGSPVFSVTYFGGSYSVTVSGQPAGSYSASAAGDSPGCLNFSIDPASTPYPVTIGGELLPINRLQVILPWLVLIAWLSTISVWTLVVKRKRSTT